MTTPLQVQFPPPVGIDGLNSTYGKFNYTELSKGLVLVDKAWESANLVVAHDVGGTGIPVQGHFRIISLFDLCLREAIRRSDYKVRMLGGYCARHKMNDPKRQLSIHSWGAAFDINWDTNGVGTGGDMPSTFISAFEEQGWEWGGRWAGADCDPMHYQYARGI